VRAGFSRVLPTESVAALSVQPHARHSWQSIVDGARPIVSDVLFACSVLLAFMCACVAGLCVALVIAFIAQGQFGFALGSALAATVAVLACLPALHLDGRRAARPGS
jgi:Zn-dependent protease